MQVALEKLFLPFLGQVWFVRCSMRVALLQDGAGAEQAVNRRDRVSNVSAISAACQSSTSSRAGAVIFAKRSRKAKYSRIIALGLISWSQQFMGVFIHTGSFRRLGGMRSRGY
jgi:hypothetical protein